MFLISIYLPVGGRVTLSKCCQPQNSTPVKLMMTAVKNYCNNANYVKLVAGWHSCVEFIRLERFMILIDENLLEAFEICVNIYTERKEFT